MRPASTTYFPDQSRIFAQIILRPATAPRSVDFSFKVQIIKMADTFVDMNHEYDNDLVNVLEAIAAASDTAATIHGTICEGRADQRQQQPVVPSAAPRPAASHDRLMHPGSLVRVQAERLPRRAEQDARKKSKQRIVGSMSRPIDLKEQATRSTGASEIAAGPAASKKPKRMVKGTMSCELTAAAAETTRPLKRKYPNVRAIHPGEGHLHLQRCGLPFQVQVVGGSHMAR